MSEACANLIPEIKWSPKKVKVSAIGRQPPDSPGPRKNQGVDTPRSPAGKQTYNAADADALAEELGDLPLALAQAAGFMAETKTSYAKYLELYRTRREELWRDEAAPDEHREKVDVTYSLNIQEIEHQNPAVGDLLNLCSFLAPDNIPRQLLVEQSTHLPETVTGLVEDDLRWAQAIKLLGGFSLVESDGESLSIHRVVQAAIRHRLTAEQRPPFAAAAVKLVNAVFPEDLQTNVMIWPIIHNILPHAQSAAAHAEQRGLESATTGRLLNCIGLYLRIRAEYAEAKSVLERSISIAEMALGLEHHTVAIRVNNLGLVLRDLGDLLGARQAFERALQIDEKVFGSEDPNLVRDVNNLGGVLRELGELSDAKFAFERALKIGETAFGTEHPSVAAIVNNLGGVYQAIGDLPAARHAIERAVRIGEAMYGRDHPNVALRLNNLGSVLQDLWDLPGAKQAFERALVIFSKFLGDEHPSTKNVRGNLEVVNELLGGKQ